MNWEGRNVTCCCVDAVGYDDGTLTIKDKVLKLKEKITGVLWVLDNLWVVEVSGTISILKNLEIVQTLQIPKKVIPMNERTQARMNSRSCRILTNLDPSMLSSDVSN